MTGDPLYAPRQHSPRTTPLISPPVRVSQSRLSPPTGSDAFVCSRREALRLFEPDPDKVEEGQPLPTEMKIVVDSTNVPVGVMVSKKGYPYPLDKDGNPRLIQMAWAREEDQDEATGQLMMVLKHKKPVDLDDSLVPIVHKRPKLDVRTSPDAAVALRAHAGLHERSLGSHSCHGPLCELTSKAGGVGAAGFALQVGDFVNTETGLASVHQKLPDAFRAIYKGPGHEVRNPCSYSDVTHMRRRMPSRAYAAGLSS